MEDNSSLLPEIVCSSSATSFCRSCFSKLSTDKCILSFVGVRKKWDWDCASLITHIDGIGENEKIHDAITNQTYSTKETISFFYQIGFLRKVIREPGKRVKYRMYYEDDTINYQKSIFDIHPAFRKKFTNS